MRFLRSLLETELGWMCGCLCKRCKPKETRNHCGEKLTGCFRKPK